MIRPQNAYIYLFILLALVSGFFVFHLKFSFNLEQFFPEGDEDLEFYRNFSEDFETDVNYLMIAVENQESVFDSLFLNKFHDLTLKSRALPHVTQSLSLTTLSYPLKTPFGITTLPIIHRNNPSKYQSDQKKIISDERFAETFISKKGDALVLALKTIGHLDISQSQDLIAQLEKLIESYAFDDYHILGPAYFQKEMVSMQQREVLVSAIVSGILVSIILFWLFRKWRGILIAATSIALGLLLFMGLLGAWGRDLNAMAALYPVLMIIVGTSDVIHIMSKYTDELRKGKSKKAAIDVTIREIGLATLLTSLTTAVGFATLVSSRVIPIRDFGINAAIGVLIAYVTVLFFTTSLLVKFDVSQLIKVGRSQKIWDQLMLKAYHFTLRYPTKIILGAGLVLLLTGIGISKVSTNYRIESNLPIDKKVTTDFKYFEEELVGFRPLEVAVFVQEAYTVEDYKVIKEIEKLEQYLQTLPTLGGVTSVTSIYKTLNRMEKGNRQEAYQMPKNEATFLRYQKMAKRLPADQLNVMVSEDKKKARITTRVLDLGADSIKVLSQQIDNWISENADSSIVQYRQTGTGLILDKNAEYIRRNLIGGLGMAILMVSLLMALLFRDFKMVLISLIPNVFPLLLAGALLGYLHIELDAGISIVFAVVFGIAVDDTIHFLSKYLLSRRSGKGMEEALKITFLETGKAICITSIILFFGFLVMLFSIHPPSVNIGWLISLTLFSALISDLMLIPLLIRFLDKD